MSGETPADGDLATLFDAATEAAAAAHAGHELGEDQVGFVLPAGYKLERVDLEARRAIPGRKKGTVRLTTTDSLVRYLTPHTSDGTWAYVDPEKLTVTAVVNDHSDEFPGWGDHRAVLSFTPTTSWKRWTAVDGEALSQTAFAELIEDGLGDIAEPSGADLLEIAQSLHITKDVQFRSDRRLQSGAVNLAYVEDVGATAGRDGTMQVPSHITLVLAPFEGADPVAVKCRFRYRLRDGKLTVGIIIDQRAEVIRAAVQAEAEKLDELLDARVLWGTAR